MNEKSDNFYEGPPLEAEERWHDNAVVGDDSTQAGERQAPSGSLNDVDLPEGGAYPPQDLIERPHSSQVGSEHNTLTRDPSHSRAVDRDEAGLDPEGAGYDRANEGPSPGPLDADAEHVPADSGDHPGGQYGSSG